MKRLYAGLLFILLLVSVDSIAQAPLSAQNYIIEKDYKRQLLTPNNTAPVSDVNKTVSYFDGLGRPLQTIIVQGSPNKNDFIQPYGYDANGRESIKYQPYSEIGNGGLYRTDALQASAGLRDFYNDPPVGVNNTTDPYSVTVFELSALNRVKKQGFPGTAWQPLQGSLTDHTLKMDYGTNTAGDVKLWKLVPGGAISTGAYTAGRLYKTTSKDENWKTANEKSGTADEYKDLNGLVILKRIWETNVKSLSTYYVYDDLGNLTYVLPPAVNEHTDRIEIPISSFTESDDVFKQFIYGYHYDGLNRLIEKKIPGKALWEYFVYNKLDQVVLTQDGQQRANGEWIFSKYDVLGRQIINGLYNDTRSRDALQVVADSYTSFWESRDNANTSSTGTGYTNAAFPKVSLTAYNVINYYDDYSFYANSFGAPFIPPVVTPLPGAPIPPTSNLVDGEWVRGLLTGTKVRNLGTGNLLLSVNYYDDKGRVVEAKMSNHLNGTDEIDNTFNFAGELTSSIRTHLVDGVTTKIANGYEYDHMGRKLITREKINTDAEIVLSKLTYNEIGQLIQKDLHSTTNGVSFAQTVKYRYNARGWLEKQSSPLFAMELKYNLDSTGLEPQYNGNISGQKWGLSSNLNKSYIYTYDKLNRLNTGVSHDKYNEFVSYDVMGNIESLQRYAANLLVDQMAYNYQGNRLSSVVDVSTNTDPRFQTNGTTGYTYNDNGSMLERINAANALNNMTNVSYNYLNLPASINANGALISYTYDAVGNKLKKVVSGTININNDYISGIHYEAGALKFINTEEGRAVKSSGGDYRYEYALNDHLGNGRLYFDIIAGVARKIQETDYYAFGLDIQKNLVGTENKYQYNGKEKQDQEKMFDYGARFYDPVIGRWNVIDPSAESYIGISPYNYVLNNPIKRIDPNGKDAIFSVIRDKDGNITGVNISSTIYIKGSGASEKRADELTSFAKGILKSKDVDGVNVSFTLKYQYSEDKNKKDLERGENLLTFDAGVEGENGNTSHINAPDRMSMGNVGTIYSSGKRNHTVLHESIHFLGLGDRYMETQMSLSGPRTVSPHIGYEKDIMGSYSHTGFKEIYYQYFLNKASTVMSSSDKFFYHPIFNYMKNKPVTSFPNSQRVDVNPNGSLKDFTNIRQ